MSKSNFCVFVHSSITTQINPCLSVSGKFQIIVSLSETNEYLFDIEPEEIIWMEMMGRDLVGSAAIFKAIEFLENSLRMKIWDQVTEAMEEEIRLEGGIEEFVKNSTGIQLPALNVLEDKM